MNSSKWNLILTIALSLIFARPASSTQTREQQPNLQKRNIPMVSTNRSQPYWDHIIREFIFKTVSPSPGNHELYRRLLDAPFYGGPFPIVLNDTSSILLSRGEVHYLPNNHWLLCQEGCIDCEVCTQHTHPIAKWMLRRVKRFSARGSIRYDLQLTIIPQFDGSYHTKNLWPRSYVYVTSQGEQVAYWNDKYGLHNPNAYSNPEEKSNNFWNRVDDDSLSEGIDSRNNSFGKELSNFENTTGTPEVKTIDTKNLGKQRTVVKVSDRKRVNASSNGNERGRLKQFAPKLILGTDQLGQKHLVHVVPADGSNVTSINSVTPSGLNFNGQNKNAYQKILRRILDSLNSNRRSIENFLGPIKQSKKTSQKVEEHQQEETRKGVKELKELARLYPFYDKRIGNESLLNHWPFSLNWKRQRRKFSNETADTGFINDDDELGNSLSSNYSLNPEILSFINSTINRYINSGNDSIEFRSGNSISNDSLIATNLTRNDEEYKFAPRRFKLIVSTESTTKSGEVKQNRNIFGNQSNALDDALRFNLGNFTR